MTDPAELIENFKRRVKDYFTKRDAEVGSPEHVYMQEAEAALLAAMLAAAPESPR